MSEILKASTETYADLDAAREFGYSRMGESAFNDFVGRFQANQLAIKTINGRLRAGNLPESILKTNVHILASVDTAEELAIVQAGILQALDNPEAYVAAIISEYQEVADLETSMAFSKMKGKVFYEDSIDRLDLLTYSDTLPKSLLLISQPSVISAELSQSHFGYRWPVDFNLDHNSWQVNDIEVITKTN
jgi:hypothetical protein